MLPASFNPQTSFSPNAISLRSNPELLDSNLTFSQVPNGVTSLVRPPVRLVEIRFEKRSSCQQRSTFRRISSLSPVILKPEFEGPCLSPSPSLALLVLCFSTSEKERAKLPLLGFFQFLLPFDPSPAHLGDRSTSPEGIHLITIPNHILAL